MTKCNASISKIETFGLVDGPGIRTVVFFNGCRLRCKFCHNPETWNIKKPNYTKEELIKKILRSKPYFQKNGGVTLSGGEPLLQYDFLLELCKDLKKEGIHIALDTAGIGNGNYSELLKYVDLVLLDIKHIDREMYKTITQTDNIDKFNEFVKDLNKSNTKVWIRQVIIPGINDNNNYLNKLSTYIKLNIKNVEKIEFLPFHTMAFSKYKMLNIKNPYENTKAMDNNKCEELYNKFMEIYNK